jgi:type I restriction enzyme, R subunit
VHRFRRDYVLDALASHGIDIDEVAERTGLHGISQLDDLSVLQVPPLSRLGSPAEIAARFGSADALHRSVATLGELLYAT